LLPSFFDHLEDRLNLAVYDINQDIRMSAQEVNQALSDITVSPITKPETKPMTTIAEQLKAARAQLIEARQGAANAVTESADASRVVLGEVNKVLKEASDLRAEVAELTNGGPA
jgi:hypothetical protein